MLRAELVAYLDDYLRIADIPDYGPQGLQVEGRAEVQRIVGLVDAGPPCVEAALDHGADLMLVHHGILWGPARRLAGGFGALVRRLFDAELNLYAAHLALDAHSEVGNNAELARSMGLEVVEWWAEEQGTRLAALAIAPDGTTLDALLARFALNVGPVRVVQDHGPRQVRRVGILSGSGARHIDEAAALGCDTFITGETSHAQYYDALGAGINVVYGGHYTTETVGVKALGRHLAERFDLSFEFVDQPTGL